MLLLSRTIATLWANLSSRGSESFCGPMGEAGERADLKPSVHSMSEILSSNIHKFIHIRATSPKYVHASNIPPITVAAPTPRLSSQLSIQVKVFGINNIPKVYPRCPEKEKKEKKKMLGNPILCQSAVMFFIHSPIESNPILFPQTPNAINEICKRKTIQ